MMKNNVMPKLRFREFGGAWERVTLGQLMTFKNGVNASKEEYGSGYKFINVLDIINNNVIYYNNIIGQVNISEKDFNKNIVEYGDILFQRSSETREEVGQSNIYFDKDKAATFGGFVIRGKKIEEYDSLYMHFLLKTSKARCEITTKSGGSTRYNVGQETLSNVVIYKSPSLAEQEKVANYLSALDEKISLLSKKEVELLRYKKAIMQKLFAQEIRFKDDDGNEFEKWEEKMLGDVSEIAKGQQLNKENFIVNGIYKVLNGGISHSGFTNSFNKSKNKITISEGGNSCGYVNYMKEDFWLGGHCYSIDNLSNSLYDLYLYHYLKFHELLIMSLRVGSGLPNIQKADLVKFKIQLPNLAEQQKIANYVSSIDEKINVVQNQIKEMQSFKKAMLQQMFV